MKRSRNLVNEFIDSVESAYPIVIDERSEHRHLYKTHDFRCHHRDRQAAESIMD